MLNGNCVHYLPLVGRPTAAIKNNLFIASLSATHIDRLVIKNNKVAGEERLLVDKNERFRDVTYLNNMLYAINDGGDIYRISKK